ncbi:MAG: DUF3791 domain-containing protein [Oscillospiraceae bacterium]|jgi:hypothetical protein|nr:DUF3791 domain-containing protein [Oscillospiraceae bacterium]
MNQSSINKQEINYLVLIFNEFAKLHNISILEAYQYISQYKGLEFLLEFYDVNHTLSTDDVVDDVAAICAQNGGAL